jgi:hypothetical protein
MKELDASFQDLRAQLIVEQEQLTKQVEELKEIIRDKDIEIQV